MTPLQYDIYHEAMRRQYARLGRVPQLHEGRALRSYARQIAERYARSNQRVTR